MRKQHLLLALRAQPCPLMQSFAADPVYVKGEVFAYVGRPRNLKDLKDPGACHGNVACRRNPSLAARGWCSSQELLSGGTATRWSTNLSSKVNLHYTINLRALCGANLVRQPSKIRTNEIRKLHRVAPSSASPRLTDYH